MTTEEIYRKYVDLVVLLIETAGNETGNTVYKNVENIFKSKEASESTQGMIDNDVPFEIFVLHCLTIIVCEVHGYEELRNKESGIEGLVVDLFTRYMKKATKKFASKYGLSLDCEKIEEKVHILVRRIDDLPGFAKE